MTSRPDPQNAPEPNPDRTRSSGGGAAHDLELDRETMRGMIDTASERVLDWIETIGDHPAQSDHDGGAVARELVEPLPSDATPFENLLGELFERIIPPGLETAGPGYLAYVPGGGLFHSAVADFITNAVNRYVGVWLPAPGLTQIEVNVVRWLAEIVGLPESAGGFLTTGGSLANLAAVVAARDHHLRDGYDRGTVYVSDQAHHCVERAARVAGIRADRVRRLPTNDDGRLLADPVVTAIEADRRDGLQPFLVVASAGTTNTGAVDDLTALADVAQEHGSWFHVDAAYGGFFRLTERGAAALAGIERADSVVVDPHKGLFLPYGNGALLVRDPATLRRAFSTDADYMPDLSHEPEMVDFSSISPELSRDMRGLRLWLPLRMHGIDTFRRALDEKLDLARHAAEGLARIPEIEVVTPPTLSIVTFRMREPGHWRTRMLQKKVNESRRVFLSGTKFGGRHVIRICVLSFRTHRDRIDEALAIIADAARDLAP